MAKYTSPYSGERIDHSVKAIPDTNPKEESILVISSAGEGSYKKVSEVGATVVQETGNSETQVMSQKAVTNALGTKVDEQGVKGMISDLVVQTTGEATDKVMSQDATTKELSKKTDKGDLVNEHLLKWDAVNNKIVDTGKTTADFVPKIVHPTEYRMYCQRPSGAAVNPGGIEMIEYTSNSVVNTIAYRGGDGVLRGATASKNQTNYDLINRGELKNKLSDKASKTYIHKVNILTSNGGVPSMEIQVYSKSATLFTQISDIPDGCYTMTNFGDEYFGLLAFYSGKISRIWNSRNTLNCEAYITPSETSYIFDGDTVVEL